MKPSKVQAIQSTSDGRTCKQEVLINELLLWSRSLNCPPILTAKQSIYMSGDYKHPNAEARNFQFFTHPIVV